jgi:hypothetical protein
MKRNRTAFFVTYMPTVVLKPSLLLVLMTIRYRRSRNAEVQAFLMAQKAKSYVAVLLLSSLI